MFTNTGIIIGEPLSMKPLSPFYTNAMLGTLVVPAEQVFIVLGLRKKFEFFDIQAFLLLILNFFWILLQTRVHVTW